MDLQNLINNVRAFFLDQYHDELNDTDTFISFEPLGHLISPDSFKVDNVFVPALAAEQLSVIADVVPAVSDVFMPDSLNKASDSYGLLVSSLKFFENNITDSDISPYMSLFGKIKDDAVNRFKSQASVNDPMSTIYPCNSEPTTWYDVTAPIWVHKSFKDSDAPPAHPVIIDNKENLLWKMNPIQEKINQAIPIVHVMNNQAIMSRINVTRLNTVSEPAAAVQPASSVHSDVLLRARTSSATSLNVRQSNAAVQSTASPASPPQTLSINRSFYTAINTMLPLTKMVAVNRVIGIDDNTFTQPVQSNQLTMDFDYSLVTLSRPWIDSQLFEQTKIWCAAGFKAGYFSTGDKTPANNGLLRALPVAMIVVKDLSITATWSDADKQSATTAYGLGAFNLTHSSFTNNTLTAPGIQIIGWICQVLPQLSMNDDSGTI